MPLIYGINPVMEAIESGKTINKIYAIKGSKDVFEIIKKARDNKIIVVESDKLKLDRMITLPGEKNKNSQGIVASVTDFSYSEIQDILNSAKEKGELPFIIILDKIEDPHNLGAIIRSSECMGVHGVIIQKRNACQITDVVEKTSAGAISYMKVARVTNITNAIKELKDAGLWIYGLDMDGKNIYETDLKGAVGIVVGSEGEGLSRLVKENCDEIIKIPMTGNINSLNASVSAGISIYEVRRQMDK